MIRVSINHLKIWLVNQKLKIKPQHLKRLRLKFKCLLLNKKALQRKSRKTVLKTNNNQSFFQIRFWLVSTAKKSQNLTQSTSVKTTKKTQANLISLSNNSKSIWKLLCKQRRWHSRKKLSRRLKRKSISTRVSKTNYCR